MSNPLSIFRRHQRTLLAVFGVTIVLIFVIGGSLDKFMSAPPGAGRGGATQVVSWNSGSLTEAQFTLVKRRHGMAIDFLRRVVELTRKRNGTPKAPVIQAAQSEEDLLARILLAEQAEKMGVVMDDQAISDYLTLLSDEMLTAAEFGDILQQVDRAASEDILFSQLRTELLARNMNEMARTSLRAAPPSQTWRYFLRLNRRVVTEIYPLKTEDFVAKIEASPSEAELRDLFEKHKEQLSNPNLPEPGFRQPLRLAFRYFKANFEDFLQAELKNVTEEQIKAEYEKRVAQGQYKTTEPAPGAEGEKPAGEGDKPAAEGDKPAEGEKPAGEGDKPATEGDKPAEGEKPAGEGEKAESEKPEGDKPAGETPEKKPEGEKPAEKPEGDKENEGDCQEGAQPPTGETPALESPQAGEKKEAPQGGDEAKAEAKTDSPKTTDASKFAADGDKAEGDQGKAEAGDAAKQEGDQAKPGDETKSGDETKAGDEANAGENVDAEKTPDAPKERVRTLDEVRDEIARTLARPAAQKNLDNAIQDIEKQLKSYSSALSRYEAKTAAGQTETASGEPLEKPTEPDYEALAAKYGLSLGETRPAGPLEISETELGQAQTFSFAGGQFQQITFPQIAYRPGVPLYQPDKIGGQLSDTTFLFWRTAIEEEHVPTFVDVKDEVEAAWKQQKAYELALKAAEELQTKLAATPGKPLVESLTEEQAKTILRPLPFSWLTQGAAMRFQGNSFPRLSDVEGVDIIGQDFMKAVFAGKPDEIVVASNNPQTEVCVVRVQGFTPDDDQLKRQFMTVGPTQSEGFLASMDNQIVISDWYQGMLEELGVSWKRDPAPFQ